MPGGPGHSHQSVRDISAIGSVPGLTAIEPCSEREARLAIRWAVEENAASTYLRFVNVPLDLPYALPASYALRVGRGVMLREGTDVALVGYGPLLMTNAWRAADELAAAGHQRGGHQPAVAQSHRRCLGREALGRFPAIVTLDNHYVTLGQGVMVGAALARTGVRAEFRSLGLTDVPACGNNAEVLAHHGLDAASIARIVLRKWPRRELSHDQVRSLDRRRRSVPSGAPSFEKRCPIDDRVVASVARGTEPTDVARAVDAAAAAAADAWGRLPAPKRGEILGRAAALLRAKEREFGEIVQTETGKPWKNAVAEVASSADLGVFMESEGSRFYGKTMTTPGSQSDRSKRSGSRSASARRSCRSTARSPASPGRCFRRSCAATPWSRSRTS